MRRDYDLSDGEEMVQKVKGAMTKKRLIGIFLLVILLAVLAMLKELVDSNTSGQFVIKQAAYTGEMTVQFPEGIVWQWFGTLWHWPNADQVSFSHRVDLGKAKDQSVDITFKNGSKGKVSGSVRMSYPIGDDKAVIEIRRKFPSHEAVMNQLVEPQINSLLNMTAMLMTPEAAMTQKGLYQQMFAEQLEHGMYMTKPAKEKFVDPITKEVMYKDVVEIMHNEQGKPLFMPNPLGDWKVKISNVAIENIEPDPQTATMIAKRRDSEMAIMVAKAQVEQANQDKLKVEAEGLKNAAESKYKAEVIKATAVVDAQREKEVAVIGEMKKVDVAKQAFMAAEQDKKTAEQEKLAAIERATGQAESRKKLLEADNALEVKGRLWLESQKYWAEAFSKRQVPTWMMGGTSGTSDVNTDVAAFMNLMTMKAAKDLNLDLGMGAPVIPKR
jgi:regulator of protease activity HflC (stomatin/prohibitin superfamily)